MSDRVAIMRDGRIEQLGTPRDVYERPATEFVAEFVGASNRLAGEDRRACSMTARYEAEVDGVGRIRAARRARAGGRPERCAIVRPEAISPTPIRLVAPA